MPDVAKLPDPGYSIYVHRLVLLLALFSLSVPWVMEHLYNPIRFSKYRRENRKAIRARSCKLCLKTMSSCSDMIIVFMKVLKLDLLAQDLHKIGSWMGKGLLKP